MTMTPHGRNDKLLTINARQFRFRRAPQETIVSNPEFLLGQGMAPAIAHAVGLEHW